MSPDDSRSSGNGDRPGLRDDLTGGRHALAYLRHLARGNETARTRLLESVDPEHPPVVLLHGFLGTRGSLYLLERRLTDDGICVFTYTLGLFNTHDIRHSALLIQRKVESILAQTRLPRVDIVGHSMGGLIGLHFVKKLGGHDKVRKLVMLGTPIRGTWSSLIGMSTVGLVSRSSWQIHPWSPYLDELRRGPLPPEVQYYTIAAERDWVCPPDATLLEGATRVTVPLGHSSLVISSEVYRHVRAALRS